MKMSLLLLMAAVLAAAASSAAVFPEEAATPFCNVGFDKLMSCKPAVTDPPEKPTSECCDVIKSADLKCLCSHRSDLSIVPSINPKLALALPKKCKISSVPPECKGH
uniref:Bifunctional inhibitor/plant lipid transfer protein/seed storage helical domain-containing protein n=1 Tax=Picea sitchensis TaxID=3332 RepID=D5AB44_PICSI|nr:unknown [Picea sitchensis]